MKTIKCPKCNSSSIMSKVTVFAEAWVDINNFEVDEVIDADFDDPTKVELAVCFNCEHEWEVRAVVVNDMYEYKSI